MALGDTTVLEPAQLLRLRYEVLREFRLSEDEALSQRASVFLLANSILVTALTIASATPPAMVWALSLGGIMLSLIGVHVGLRLCGSQRVLWGMLAEAERALWPERCSPLQEWRCRRGPVFGTGDHRCPDTQPAPSHCPSQQGRPAPTAWWERGIPGLSHVWLSRTWVTVGVHLVFIAIWVCFIAYRGFVSAAR
jgi:hypothetical protein